MKLNKLSDKTLVIISLIAIISLILLIPFESIVGKPSIIGAMVASVFVSSLETNNTCNIDMVEGWNLISFACKPDNSSVGSMLSPINGNYTSIHTYNASDDADNWKSYNPNVPSWVLQDISTINDKSGYWIKMDNNSILNVTGTISSPNSINLMQGWNLISYPSDSSKSPSDAFSGISNSYSIVWAYNASEDSYLYYSPSLGSGTLTDITPDRGYWINMTTGDTLWVT